MSRTREQIAEGESLLAEGLKRCTACAEVKPLDCYFSGRGLGGVRAKCKGCHTTQTNAWRDSNLSKVRAQERARNATPEGKRKRKEIGRRYYVKNQEACVQKSRNWRAANPERVAAMKAAYLAKEENRVAARKYSARWRAENPEKFIEQVRRRDKEKQLRRAREWKRANPEKCREYARRAISTPHGKLRNRIRSRVHEMLRSGKGRSRTFDLLGYTVEELRAHLERQFLRGMSWGNMGEWHIDHIVPLASFTITGPDDPELRRAWALTNLRPLWAKDNMSKSAKRLTLL